MSTFVLRTFDSVVFLSSVYEWLESSTELVNPLLDPKSSKSKPLIVKKCPILVWPLSRKTGTGWLNWQWMSNHLKLLDFIGQRHGFIRVQTNFQFFNLVTRIVFWHFNQQFVPQFGFWYTSETKSMIDTCWQRNGHEELIKIKQSLLVNGSNIFKRMVADDVTIKDLMRPWWW